MIIRQGAASNIGLVRRQNEDSYVVGNGVWAVCDGMGGAQAGEVASETACRALGGLHAGHGQEDLLAVVAAANAEVFARGIENPSLLGMGTTLTAALRSGKELILAQVGDSRAYLLRDGGLAQLTEDHSLVGELVRQGRLTREEAAKHPHRSVITRALGTEAEVEADIVRVPLQAGDRLVLCSDGLTGQVADERLRELLAEAAHPQGAADALVQEALANGGDDNVTVVTLFVEEGEEPADTSGAADLGPALRTSAQDGGRTRDRLPGMKDWLRRHRRGALATAVVIIVVLLGVAGAAIFNSGVYYVGTSGDSVALYQGMPHTVLGIELFTLVEVGTVPYSTLEPHVKARIDTHELMSKEEGLRFLHSLANGT